MHYTDPNNFRGIVDGLEQVGKTVVPIIATTAAGVAGAVCTVGTAGGCGAGAIAGTIAAGSGATALTQLMMNNESTEGFKKHVLRSSDSDVTTTFQIMPGSTQGTVRIISSSGTSETVWKTKTVTITDEMRAIASANAPSRPASFEMISNAGIPGFNNETHRGVSALACQDLCIGRSWCKSADFERATGNCFLQPVNRFEQSLKTNYPGNPFDHYHRNR